MRGMNEAEFFREFTLRICSSLHIQTALERCWEYVKGVFPCTAMTLHLPDVKKDRVNVVAVAGDTHLIAKGIGREIPLPKELRDLSVEAWEFLEPVQVINDVRKHHVYSRILQSLGIDTDVSIMVLRLELEDNRVGSLWVWATKRGRFSDKEAGRLLSVHDPLALAMSNALQYQKIRLEKRILADDKRYYEEQLLGTAGDVIIGADSGMKEVMDQVRQVAVFDSPVVLHGETGVGKEIVAQTIHCLSPRSKGPFVKVNCGAIPDTLIDSELFGHEKGAFTGAVKEKRGRFQRADGGTIFLDEISEMPGSAQIRLLHVLQTREIERVGGSETLRVDVRVIAATNRNLEQLIASGSFRDDLWFRLNVFPIQIPPLRMHRQDIRALVDYFVEKKSEELRIKPPPGYRLEDLDRLVAYDWPGNVRELKNLVERALIKREGGVLDLASLVEERAETWPGLPFGSQEGGPSLNEMITASIRRALVQSKGKISGAGGAAELLRLHPNTLRNKMARLGIPVPGRKKKR